MPLYVPVAQPPFWLKQDKSFLPKKRTRMKSERSIFVIFLEGRKSTMKPNAVVRSEREARWWLAGSRLPGAAYELPGTTHTFPHLPSQHPHKTIVCLQIKILADV